MFPDNKEYDSQMMRFTNAKAGIKQYSLDTLSDEECTTFARAFHFFMTPDPSRNLASWSQDIIGMTSEFGQGVSTMDNISEHFRIESAKKSIEIAEAQIKLLEAKPIHISTGNDLQIAMQYFPTSWSGCGGVKISLADSHSLANVDAFALLGVPHSQGDTLSFNISTMQPWLKDEWPAITMAETQADKFRIKEINRLTDRLTRKVHSDDTTPDRIPLSRPDIFLLCTLAFLEKQNARSFKGISDAAINKHYPDKNINYDEVFARWFDTHNAGEKFAWTMDAGTTGCYIPHFDQLPAGMKQILIDIYHA